MPLTGIKISEYTVPALSLGNSDRFDISKLLSTTPDVWETEYLEYGTMLSIFAGASGLTSGFIPYWDGTQLANSPLKYDSGNILVNNGTYISSFDGNLLQSFGSGVSWSVIEQTTGFYIKSGQNESGFHNSLGSIEASTNSLTGDYIQLNNSRIKLKHSAEVRLDAPAVTIFQNLIQSGFAAKSIIDFGSFGDNIYMSTDGGNFNEGGLALTTGLGALSYGANKFQVDSNTALIQTSGFIVFDSPVYNYAQLTASRVPYIDASKNLVVSSVTPTELGYLSGTSSIIQTQLNAKQPLDADLTAIAALTASSGFLKTNGAGTWTIDTSSYLTISSAASTYAPIASPTFTGTVTLGQDATTGLQAVTYQQLQQAILGQNAKEACKYATTTALPAVVYNNGTSGVGATLTAVSFGAISFDGATPSVGDRVMVKNQVSTFQNGSYTVTVVGGVATLFVLTRTTDFNQSAEIKTGDSFFISSGSTLSATTWTYTGIDNPVMGTDVITFVQTTGQGSFIAGSGITITGTTISITTSGVTNAMLAGSITDGNLLTPYIKADGTRALSGNWAAGSFYISSSQFGAGTGSTAPSSTMHVVETSTSTPRGILADQYSTGISGSRITMRKARGTFASPTVIVTGDTLASWTASGYDGANFIDSGKILISSIGTIGTGIVPSTMAFQTMNASGVLTTGFTIDQSQNSTFAGTNTALSYSANGTAGAGFMELLTQSSSPSSGASNSVRVFSSAGWMAWRYQNDTFLRKFDGALTADRTYTLPDKSGTIALTNDLKLGFHISHVALSPADSSTYYFGTLQFAPNATSTVRQFKFPKSGTLTDFVINIIQTTNGSNEAVTIKLRDITGGTSTTLGTFTSDFGTNAVTSVVFNNLSVSITASSYYSVEYDTPAFATNPAGWQVDGMMYFTPA